MKRLWKSERSRSYERAVSSVTKEPDRMIAYVYKRLFALVLRTSGLIPEYHIVIPSVKQRQPPMVREIPASLPSLRISLLVWVEERIAKSYVIFSLVLLGFGFLKFL